MLTVDVLTLFPRVVEAYVAEGILGRAIDRGLVCVRVHDIRTFATDPHRQADDYPYGGGSGMVMKAEPIIAALRYAQGLQAGRAEAILLTPQGERFSHAMAGVLAERERLLVVCGRYEGVDERIREGYVDREISIGDYVVSGGEAPALVVMDAVARRVPGVVGDPVSVAEDSLASGLLKYPQYTRPAVVEGRVVPDVLLSGDHERIRAWRRREALRRTFERRPDLLIGCAGLSSDERAFLESLGAGPEIVGEGGGIIRRAQRRGAV